MKTPFINRPLRLALACVALTFAAPAFADDDAAPPANQEETKKEEAPAEGEAKAEEGEAKAEGETKEEAAPEPLKYRTVKTKGWTAEIPDPWFERTVHRKVGKRPELGRWVYTSPSRGYVFQVNVERNKGKFTPQAEALIKRAEAKLTNSRIEKEDQFVEPSSKTATGRQVRFAIMRGDKADRTGKKQRYHVLVMVSRSYGENNRMLSIRLLAADRKVDDFLDVAERIISSFKTID